MSKRVWNRKGPRLKFSMTYEEIFEVFENEIRQFAELSRAHDFKLVLMPISSYFYVYEKKIVDYARKNNYLKIDAMGRPPKLSTVEEHFHSWLKAMAIKYKLSYWDLPKYLKTIVDNGQRRRLYYKYDPHFNDEGNAIAGRFVAEKLAACQHVFEQKASQ